MCLLNTRRNVVFAVATILVLLSGLATGAAAQSQAGTGQIVGTVYDSTGALVPEAKVTLNGKATGLTREDTSGDEGQFLFPLLPTGVYTVTVTKPGFKTFKVEVEVTVGSAQTVRATLEPGEITQVVEVTETPVVETTTPQATALVDLNSITSLPINGRRFHDFVTLAPTVQIEPQRNQISFAGQRGINGNVTIDGADYNQPFFGGMRGGERSVNAFSIPQEAIAQFQVVPYGYSAEFGRSSGGVMNAVTKSGANDFHGSAFYFNRHKDLSKVDAFNRKALDDQHQFGGSLGGPVARDKVFFFAAYEQQINDNPRVVIFRELDELTPPVTAPTSAHLEAFNFFRSLEEPFAQTNDALTGLGRLDFQLGSNHRLTTRYHYSKNEGLNAAATGNQINPETNIALESNGTEGDSQNTGTAQWTAIFSPRVVMETRFQYSREERPRLANSLKAGIASSIGDTGTRQFFPTTESDWRAQWAQNLTWTMGEHTLRFGGEYNHLFADQFFKFNQFGIFGFGTSTDTTILSILSLDPANPNDRRFDSTLATYRVNVGNGLLDMSLKELAFFIQDTWRITPRFTLTAGFRWEGYFNPESDTSNTTLTDVVRNATNLPIGLRVDPSFIPDNFRQYMPRVGFAWDPFGKAKTVIRANAGFYYARNPLLLFAAPLNNFRTPPGDLSAELPFTGFSNCAAIGKTPLAPGDTCNTVYWQMRRIGIDLNTFTLDNLPTLTPQDIQDIAAALGLGLNIITNPITWANNYESPRSWQWSIGAEHELARGLSLGADFVYNNTIHLERNREYNLPAPILVPSDKSLRPCFGVVARVAPCGTSPTGTPAGSGIRPRPIPTSAGLLSLQVRESNGRALYRAFILRSSFRRSRYQFMGSYTLSYNNSDDDNERSAGGQGAVNAFDLPAEYGPSSLDSRHQLTFSSVVDLPLAFTVGASARWSSARPFTPVTANDDNGDNIRNDRPFQAPGVPFGRNSFRDRDFKVVNVRVAKRFNLPGETARIELTADFFNLFNFHNVTYGSFTQRYGNAGVSPTTGAILAPASSFQRLRNSASCLSPTNPTGNPECYDTTNNVGSPFVTQFGIRFQF